MGLKVSILTTMSPGGAQGTCGAVGDGLSTSCDREQQGMLEHFGPCGPWAGCAGLDQALLCHGVLLAPFLHRDYTESLPAFSPQSARSLPPRTHRSGTACCQADAGTEALGIRGGGHVDLAEVAAVAVVGHERNEGAGGTATHLLQGRGREEIL